MSDLRLLGFAGDSGSGKTTLLEQLIPLLVTHGLRIAVVKHAHHDFEIDKPGKDSHRHRQAGADQVVISSKSRWAVIHELRHEPEPTLHELCTHLSPCDLILVEGYKQAAIPKLEIHRTAHGGAPLYPHDAHIIAVVTDNAQEIPLPVLDINAPHQVVAFILEYFNLDLA